MSDNGLPEGFGQNNPDFIREAYVESQKMRGDEGSVLFLKTGVTTARFLPPHVDAPSWFRAYKEHGIHPGGKYRTFTCPASVDGSECPICEEGTRLYEAKELKEAKRLYAKQAFLYNAYVYSSPDSKGLKDGIFVIKSGVKVYKQLMEYDNDPAGDWGNISDLENGFDFRIERKGAGRYKTEYSVMPMRQQTNIIEKVAAAGFEFGTPTDLTTVYPPLSYEELEAVLESDEPKADD
jgi:hypothetical protein